MPVTDTSQVSVIIPTAEPNFLEDCLRALVAQSSRRFEVIVVENGPRNPRVGEQVARIAKDQPNRYLYERTPGLNRARNRGCRAARHDILALLDDDCVPAKNWIAAILDHHRRFSNAGVIGGQVQLRFLAERPKWLAGELLLNLSQVHWADKARMLRRGEFIVGANMTFRASVFESTGGFNEDFGLQGRTSPQLSNDETLFVHQAARYGDPGVVYAPGVVVQHQIPPSRLRFEYHEQRRYGQGVSDIDLADREQSQGPWSAYEKFREMVQHQQWHLNQLFEASRALNDSAEKSFRRMLVLTRVAYLVGAQDRILSRFVPGSINAPLSLDEVRPYRAGRRAARAFGGQADEAHDALKVLLYRDRPRHLHVTSCHDRRTLHARVAFLRGFTNELRGFKYPNVQTVRIRSLERIPS